MLRLYSHETFALPHLLQSRLILQMVSPYCISDIHGISFHTKPSGCLNLLTRYHIPWIYLWGWNRLSLSIEYKVSIKYGFSRLIIRWRLQLYLMSIIWAALPNENWWKKLNNYISLVFCDKCIWEESFFLLKYIFNEKKNILEPWSSY